MTAESIATLASRLIRKLTPPGCNISVGHALAYDRHKGGVCPPSGDQQHKEQDQMEMYYVHSLTISKQGIEFIKRWEGCHFSSYRDGGGVWTIGYGHTEHVFAGSTITQAQANILLRQDIMRHEAKVRAFVNVRLTQNQYDALVSFVFNIGGTQFRKSTLLRMLNAGDYEQAADQFLRWQFDNGEKVAGLLKRRRDERLLFTGHYGVDADV